MSEHEPESESESESDNTPVRCTECGERPYLYKQSDGEYGIQCYCPDVQIDHCVESSYLWGAAPTAWQYDDELVRMSRKISLAEISVLEIQEARRNDARLLCPLEKGGCAYQHKGDNTDWSLEGLVKYPECEHCGCYLKLEWIPHEEVAE